MSHFNTKVYDDLKQFWTDTRVKRVVMVVETARGKIEVLGNPKEGQKLFTEAVRRKLRRSGDFLPRFSKIIFASEINFCTFISNFSN